MVVKSDIRSWSLLFSAFTIALVASAGALFIGEVMGQAPCNLCWFQRAFMFPITVVLGVAALRSDMSAWLYGLVLAISGGLISGFHVLVYAGVIPDAIQPCTTSGPSCSGAAMTIFGNFPLPVLSLGAFTAIATLLYMSRPRVSS